MKRSEFLRLTSASTASIAARGALGAWFLEQTISSAHAQGGGAVTKPYLQTPRPDSIRVSWWSDAAMQAFVDWGTAADQLTNTVTGGTQNLGSGYRYHSAKITGLQPSSYYYYQVRTELETSSVFRFRLCFVKHVSSL